MRLEFIPVCTLECFFYFFFSSDDCSDQHVIRREDHSGQACRS